ncbi:carboxypeptidase-like regulatory domain-containing protein [Hymenobacter sp. YC55]|uniref:carboxypeptidase-like regulatory domain-containing protein n=1 Tax=Hymenobacter sp. YC55 TaxID=3034019 RepID=UPI0023F98043|nr:carboxypeptidase-like regulatory domain-containing protein [Hymenobacter sp. YC55]MDF7811160.1 carboxypeptidase-like regulatory domain-containing protein [Hymenobacter sp. YC55]
MKTSFVNRSLLAFILFMSGLQLSAHLLSSGTLSGSLRDGDTKEPIPHTSVVLLRATDNRVAATGTTDAQGNFHFRRVPIGEYVVKTTVLGYQPQQPTIALRALHNRHQMGVLTLRSSSTQPTVTGSRNTSVVAQQVEAKPAAVKPAA